MIIYETKVTGILEKLGMGPKDMCKFFKEFKNMETAGEKNELTKYQKKVFNAKYVYHK